MSRRTLATVALVIAAMLLAVGLFFAGAMWRARITRAPSLGNGFFTAARYPAI